MLAMQDVGRSELERVEGGVFGLDDLVAAVVVAGGILVVAAVAGYVAGYNSTQKPK